MARPDSLLNIKSALRLVALSTLSSHTVASVISASKASSTNFELQTNIVSCGTATAGGDSASAAVCTPPESKLFNNIKVVDGTPHPGSTGVRGRLYDVGTLCESKVVQKIDRAWVAFLDCSGCPLTNKLANLLSSNPQAILIYNQAACVYPAPAVKPAPQSPPEHSSSAVAPPQSSSTVSSPAAPAATSTQDPTPVATPAEPSDGGGDGEENPGGEEDGESRQRPPVVKRALKTVPRRQLLKRVENNPPMEKHKHHGASLSSTTTTTSAGEPYIDSSTTIAVAEQVTIDYLFQILKGPAANAPVPAALQSIKTTIHHLSPTLHTQGEEEDQQGEEGGEGNNEPNDSDGSKPEPTTPSPSTTTSTQPVQTAVPSNAVTDLMVSISPSYGDTGAGDQKFLSMSKPIFATVVGLLTAVVCGVVLMYVVRPLVRRSRVHKMNMSEMSETPSTPMELSKDHRTSRDDFSDGSTGAGGVGDVGAAGINDRPCAGMEDSHDQVSNKPTDGYLTRQSQEWNRFNGNPSNPMENSSQQPIPDNFNTTVSSTLPPPPPLATIPSPAVDVDDESSALQHLQQLRLQEPEAALVPVSMVPPSHDLDELRSGLPVWRQISEQTVPGIVQSAASSSSVPATEAQEIIAIYNAKQSLQQQQTQSLPLVIPAPDIAQAYEDTMTIHAAPDTRTFIIENEPPSPPPPSPSQQQQSILTPASTSHRIVDPQEGMVSNTSGRNGSMLFEGGFGRHSHINSSSSSSTLPTLTINTTHEAGGLASALRRQRLSSDATTPTPRSTLYYSAQSPHPTILTVNSSHHSTTTSRASFSDDFATGRTSMDSYRRDIQSRFNEITAASSSSRGGVSRASFSEDYPPLPPSAGSNGRNSLELYRPTPALSSVPSTIEENAKSSSKSAVGDGNEDGATPEVQDTYRGYRASRRDMTSGM
ncbi:hypothetical protein BG004_004081 [Podila humilis]|nr:hypothetical protein BG004_004081 [Podila humilis]